MNILPTILLALPGLGVLLAPADPPTPPEEAPREMRTLWEIGTRDDGAGEFALGIDDFHLYSSRFPGGPLYVVGRSRPETDWAHVQPGPLDTWAGGCEHTFTVRFGLDRAAASGPARLVIDLLDAHRSHPPALRVRLGDFEHGCETAPGTSDTLEQRPPSGGSQRLAVDVPAGALREGDNTLEITTRSGCWLIYDRVALLAPAGSGAAPAAPATTIVSARTRPVVTREADGSLHQALRLRVEHAGDDVRAMVSVAGGAASAVELRPGRRHVDVPAPRVDRPTPVEVTIAIEGTTVAREQVDLLPVRDWTVHLLHHTHLDIGYTHVQSEVETLQWRHLEQALALSEASAGHPPDARFRWNPEGLWAVESWLLRAAPEEKARMIDAVQRGAIGLDAFFANELTGICRPEELFELVACARRLSAEHGLTIDSAMITDIPGYTWGVVPALAHSGVRYLSIGPNRGHRIGYALSTWGDRPFYWESPSGAERVLCWTAGKGYSWFHGTWRGADTFDYDSVETALDGVLVLDYLQELEQREYPYEHVQLRYNVGSDNGPPDPGLARFVRDWNEGHAVPRLVITTTSAMFHALEERHGESIPVFRGDFTPYWEDGAASSARETATNRAASERLVQAAVLWSFLDPAGLPRPEFDEAWRKVLLFSEHTWGSWNSISAPDAEFTRRQWSTKQAFAEEADRRSRALLEGATGSVGGGGERVEAVLVFNTCSWARTDLVRLPAGWDVAGPEVRDARTGASVPAQRRADGALAFLAKDVPALGAARFTIHAGDAAPGDAIRVEPHRLSNGRVTVEIDPRTGGIRSLRHRDLPGAGPGEGPAELVDTGAGLDVNAYRYVAGRDPADPQPSGPARIEIVEEGPLLATLRIESTAPGCTRLRRDVTVIAGLDRVDLVNRLDRERVLDPEGVHFAFPFRVPDDHDPTVRYDVAWGMVELGRDQLPGACRNYFTAQRWFDVSGPGHGITVAVPDAPLFEVGAITADATTVGWLETIEPSATIYSYVMNNYWETNYLAAQEGPAEIRYALLPHGPFDAAAAKRFGIERSQPLVAVAVGASTPAPPPLLRLDEGSIIVTSIRPSADGMAIMVRLFNAADRAATTSLSWSPPAPTATSMSSPHEERTEPAPDRIELPAWGIVTLRCERTP